MADEAKKTISDPITLDTPIVRGETKIEKVQVRKPGAGELRGGVKLTELAQLDVSTLHLVLPRITVPALTEPEVAALDPADLMQLGAEVMDFLLPKAVKASLAS